jgi:hypothetical protein
MEQSLPRDQNYTREKQEERNKPCDSQNFGFIISLKQLKQHFNCEIKQQKRQIKRKINLQKSA